MGDQVNFTQTLAENSDLKTTIRWLNNFAQTVMGASSRNVIQNVGSSGAALSAITGAAAGDIPYFTGPTTADVATPLLARSATVLDIESATVVGDTNYTILPTDRFVDGNVSFSVPRTWTLPLVSSVNQGQRLLIRTPGASANFTLAAAGSDDIFNIQSRLSGTSFTFASSAAIEAIAVTQAGVSHWFITLLGEALTQRGSQGLNIENRTAVGDTDYTILPTDRYVLSSANFTAPRTWTLPNTGTVNNGTRLIVWPWGANATDTITISAQGGDNISFPQVNNFTSVTWGTNSFLYFVSSPGNWVFGGTGYFSSTNPGIVLPSGGGTTNFLRADGNWADPGGLISTITYSGSQTITIPTGATRAFLRMRGGTGGSGGTNQTNTSTGGTGGAGYLEKFLTGLTPGNTVVYTQGSAGAAGTNAPTAGGNGTASTLASGSQSITTLTANGSNGSAAVSTAGAGSAGTAGGTASNGDVNVTGQTAAPTVAATSTSNFGGMTGGGWSLGAAGVVLATGPAAGNAGTAGALQMMWFA